MRAIASGPRRIRTRFCLVPSRHCRQKKRRRHWVFVRLEGWDITRHQKARVRRLGAQFEKVAARDITQWLDCMVSIPATTVSTKTNLAQHRSPKSQFLACANEIGRAHNLCYKSLHLSKKIIQKPQSWWACTRCSIFFRACTASIPLRSCRCRMKCLSLSADMCSSTVELSSPTQGCDRQPAAS